MTQDWNEWISAYLDDELSPEDRRKFEARVADGTVSRKELEEMKSMHAVTQSLKLQDFPDDVWDRYWSQTYHRLERNVGWILFSIGAIVLLSFGAYQFFQSLWTETSGPWWLRAATACVALGLATLFVSVLRQRWFARSQDPYRGVKR